MSDIPNFILLLFRETYFSFSFSVFGVVLTRFTSNFIRSLFDEIYIDMYLI